MKVTNLGHACFHLEIGGVNIVTDPFMSPNPNCSIDPMDVKCDWMLITHGHGDHVTDAVAIANNTGCKVVANYEVANWLINQGVKNVHHLNHGGSVTTEFGAVKMVNAVHSSSFEDGSYAGHPAGFIIKSTEGNAYFAGDTALMYDMKMFGEYENLSQAFLPIGDTFTMGVDDAVIAAKMLQCSQIVGMHYDTFPPITIDKDEALKKFNTNKLELHLPSIGQTIEI